MMASLRPQYLIYHVHIWLTQMDRENRTPAILWCKITFFKRAWHKVKVLPRPWAAGSRYIMCLNSQWFRNDKPSNLKVQKKSVLVRKKDFFSNFQVWRLNHWEFLILKVWSVVKWSQQLKGVAGLLPCVTPSWKEPFYSIKGLLYRYTCPSVYVQRCL